MSVSFTSRMWWSEVVVLVLLVVFVRVGVVVGIGEKRRIDCSRL